MSWQVRSWKHSDIAERSSRLNAAKQASDREVEDTLWKAATRTKPRYLPLTRGSSRGSTGQSGVDRGAEREFG
jgi:hypothetical protein